MHLHCLSVTMTTYMYVFVTFSAEGYYVYTDASESTYLYSPEINVPQNEPYCLTFWYYMYGSSKATFKYVVVSDDVIVRAPWPFTARY